MNRFRCWYSVCLGLLHCIALALVGCAATAPPASPQPPTMPTAVPQTVITQIATEPLASAVRVLVQATGPLQYTAFKLDDPPRLVVDIAEARLGDVPQPLPVAGELVERIEPTVLPDERIVRLTLHLRRMVPHTVEAQAQQLHITLQAGEEQGSADTPRTEAPQPAGVSTGPPTPPSQTVPAVTAGTMVTGVTFVSLVDTSVLALQTIGNPPQVRVKQQENPLRLVLEVADAQLAPEHEKHETITDPGGVVTALQASQVTEASRSRVQIIAHLRASTPFEVRHDDSLVRVVIRKPDSTAAQMPVTPPPSPAGEMASPPVAPQPPATTAPPPQPAPGALPSPAAETVPVVAQDLPVYVGERISLDFQNADINDILRLIAEVSGLNIIAGGDVQGTVTTRMVDVPWDQALDVILKINGLAQERDGNIIRVAPLERFIAERQDRARARQTEDQSEPTVTQLIPVNYATASELRTNLERLLSNRGSILIDERTNTLIVTDTRRNLDDMLALVETLDRQTPQVMIEARIVETSRNFLHDLGVQLGAQYTQITDVRFPNRIDVGGSASTPGNFLVDLPAAVGQGSGGAITFALAGASNLLNLRLSALERTGRGKIISNPKIATLDNTEALIQSGRRIPVQTVSAEGTQTEFVDASLSLRVTPHVTPDGFISMRINATKNEADFGNAVNGVPSITTREATTQMLVRDSDTVVIGGLYRRTISSAHDGVPGVSRVPVLGWLFRSTQEQDDNDELLIFITPRIIRQPERQSGARTSTTSP